MKTVLKRVFSIAIAFTLVVSMSGGLIDFAQAAIARDTNDPFAAMYDSDILVREELAAISERYDAMEFSETFEQDFSEVTGISAFSVTTEPDDPIREENERMRAEEEQRAYENVTPDRYIVKYREGSTADISTVMRDRVHRTERIQDKSSNIHSSSRRSGNNRNDADSRIEVITLNERVNPKTLANELRRTGADREIEYIQPDFTLSLESILESDDDMELDSDDDSENELEDDSYLEDNIEDESEDGLEDLDNEDNIEETDIVPNLLIETDDSVIVAVIDTGIDATHPALDGYMIEGWNFPASNPVTYDPAYPLASAHGTHIAGIIAGTAREYGSDVKILPLQVFDNGTAYTSDILAAIHYAVDNGATIINCSFGSTSNNPALEEAIANATDVLFVASAGNSRSNLDELPIYPAAYRLNNIISVGSVNADGGFSYFSNYSTRLVDITALGRDVTSAIPDGEYGPMSGTSMAAAHVTSAAAVLAAQNGTDSTMLRTILLDSSDSLDNLQNKVSDGRRLNIDNAVHGVNGQHLSLNPDDDFDVHGYSPTQEEQWELFVTGKVVQVAGGNTFSAALKDDGTVWAWGNNGYGQFGDGTTTDRLTPGQIIGITNITSIATGFGHILMLKSDGTVWACGQNGHGQLGDGTMTIKKTPIQIPGLTGIKAISTGDNSSLVLRADGTVFTMGSNTYGQLGDGTTTNKSTPLQVSGLTGVTAISAGTYHNLVLRSDSTVWAWGYNGNYQLGDNTVTNRSKPVQVSGLTGVIAITAGYRHNLIIKSDRTVWAWGGNTYGQIGDGTTTSRKTPVQLSTLTGATAFSTAYYHSIVVKSDGSVYTWGGNTHYQVGDGTTIDKTTPWQVNSLFGITAVATGREHTFAIKSDGAVFAWGYNNAGQIGNGTTKDRTTPTQIISSPPPSVATTLKLTANPNTLQIPTPGSTKQSSLSVTLYDQYGAVMTASGVSYALNSSYNGVTVNASTGIVTVASDAQSGTVTLKATCNGLTTTALLTLTAPPLVATTLKLTANPSTLQIPTPGSTKQSSLSVTLYDQYGAVMTTSGVSYTLNSSYNGVTVNASTGVITVASDAQQGTVTLKATCNGLTATTQLVLTAPPLVATSIKLTSDTDTLQVPVAGTTAQVILSAKIYDQYGTEMSNSGTVYSLNTPHTGVSINNTTGLVTITSDAQPGTVTFKATCNGLPATVELTLTAMTLEDNDNMDDIINNITADELLLTSMLTYSGTVIQNDEIWYAVKPQYTSVYEIMLLSDEVDAEISVYDNGMTPLTPNEGGFILRNKDIETNESEIYYICLKFSENISSPKEYELIITAKAASIQDYWDYEGELMEEIPEFWVAVSPEESGTYYLYADSSDDTISAIAYDDKMIPLSVDDDDTFKMTSSSTYFIKLNSANNNLDYLQYFLSMQLFENDEWLDDDDDDNSDPEIDKSELPDGYTWINGEPDENAGYWWVDDDDDAQSQSSQARTIVPQIQAYTSKVTITFKPWPENEVTGNPSPHTCSMILHSWGAKFKRTGYKQIGWSTQPGGGNAYYLKDKYAFTENTDLYPVWAEDIRKIEYTRVGATGGEIPNPNPDKYQNGTSVILKSDAGSLYKTGHDVFLGWRKGTNFFAKGETAVFKGDVKLHPVWEPNTLTVEFYLNDETDTMLGTQDFKYNKTQKIGQFSLTSDDYTFDGWRDEKGRSYGKAAFVRFKENKKLYAKWKPITYTVTYYRNSSIGNKGIVPSIQKVVYPFQPVIKDRGTMTKTGYYFIGWNTKPNGSGVSYSPNDTPTLSASLKLYAQWASVPAGQYVVTYIGNGASGNAPSPTLFNSGTPVYINSQGFITMDGHTFAGWNTKPNGKGATYQQGYYNLTKSIDLYAKWTPIGTVPTTVTLFYDINGGNGVKPNNKVVKPNTSFTLDSGSNIYNDGYKFVGWNTEKDGSGKTYKGGSSFSLSSNTTLFAKWESDIWTMTFSNFGADSGETVQQKVKRGESIEVPQNIGNLKKSGYTFNGWYTYVNGLRVEYEDKTGQSITPNDNLTFIPRWKEVERLVKTGIFRYPGTFADEVNPQDSSATYHYDDAYFFRDSRTYYADLSTMSLCLELSSWSSYSTDIWTLKSRNAKNLLTSSLGIGFNDFDQNDAWNNPPTKDTIGAVAAWKPIIDDKGKDYTLIALAVRGGGYYSEWGGNFALGKTGEHAAWGTAKDEVLAFLSEYIEKYQITGDIKLWLVGYSRGGAVANMVAGELNNKDDALPSSVILSHENLYCYTFEAPQGAEKSKASDDKHTNIHNIVNVNDIVTYIAPSDWKFARYNHGKDYRLPYDAGKSNFKDELEAMLKQYDKLDGANRKDYNVKEYVQTVIPSLGIIPLPVIGHMRFTFVDNRAKPQFELLRDTVTNLATKAAESRENYHAEIETGLVMIVESLTGYEDEGKVSALLSIMGRRLITNDIGDVNLEGFVSECANEAGINTSLEILNKLVTLVVKLYEANPEVFVKFAINAFIAGDLLQAHYPEITLAWLMSQDTNYNKNATYGSAPSTVRELGFNCPVDINVYNSKSTLVASIVNDIPQYDTVDSSMIYSVNENGEKVVYLPADEEYTVIITATGNGTMTHSLNEYSLSGSNVTRLLNYYDVPLTSGESYTAVIPKIDSSELTENLPNGSSTAYKLLDKNSSVVPVDEEFRGEMINSLNYNVTVTANNDSGYVTGGGRFLKGSYAKVTAQPVSGGNFIGWFNENNELLSTDTVYRFAVKENMNLTAKFTNVEKHALYLTSGIGGEIISFEGFYAVDAKITVVALAMDGYTFINWTSSNGGTFDNANSSTTTFTMPDNDTVVTANFSGGPAPALPNGSIGLSTSLTEQQIGNDALNNLDCEVNILYNGTNSEALLKGGQTMTAKFSALNTSKKIKSVQFILALHDSNGKLVDTKMQQVLITPNGGKEINLDITIPVTTSGLQLRVMLWDNYTSVSPHTCMTITAE